MPERGLFDRVWDEALVREFPAVAAARWLSSYMPDASVVEVHASAAHAVAGVPVVCLPAVFDNADDMMRNTPVIGAAGPDPRAQSPDPVETLRLASSLHVASHALGLCEAYEEGKRGPVRRTIRGVIFVVG